MESHGDIFLSTSQKTIKNTCHYKNLYIMTRFVCSNKFECLKNVETYFKHQNMFYDVSLRFVGNGNSECLQNVALFHHRETKIKLNFSDQRQSKFLLPKSQKNSVPKNQAEGDGKYIDFPFHSTYSKLRCILHAKKVELKSLAAHFTTKIQIAVVMCNPKRQRQ